MIVISKKKRVIILGSIILILLVLFIRIKYFRYFSEETDIKVSNYTTSEVRNLKVYVTKNALTEDGNPVHVVNAADDGDSVLLAEFQALESSQTKYETFDEQMPFEGNVVLAYEDDTGEEKGIYADSGYVNASITNLYIEFNIE